MEHLSLYGVEPLPAVLRDCAGTPPMQRLRGVGMNCGCEYTSFPRFRSLPSYSRYEHSLGVALLVWRFTEDPRQAVAGLLHDISTPVFAHVVDFLRGDFLRQEATEAGTEELIASSKELQTALRRHGLTTEEVCDYHHYPIADNPSPRLSADRLEYSFGNAVNFGFLELRELPVLLGDLVIAKNEDGEDELAFRSHPMAERFALAALRCSEVYVSDEDRYAMLRLAELLHLALDRGVIREEELGGTEPELIARLGEEPETAAAWRAFRSLGRMRRAARPGTEPGWRQIKAKKRRIDPLVAGEGRLSRSSEEFRRAMERFMTLDLSVWLCGEPEEDSDGL